MNIHTLKENPCFEGLWEHDFIPDFKWNSYIRSIAKEDGKCSTHSICSRKHLTPAMIYISSLAQKNGVLLACLDWSCSFLTF